MHLLARSSTRARVYARASGVHELRFKNLISSDSPSFAGECDSVEDESRGEFSACRLSGNDRLVFLSLSLSLVRSVCDGPPPDKIPQISIANRRERERDRDREREARKSFKRPRKTARETSEAAFAVAGEVISRRYRIPPHRR